MISQREFIRRYSAREKKAQKAIPDFSPTVQKFECRVCKTVLNVKKEIPGITPEVLKCSTCSGMQLIQKDPGFKKIMLTATPDVSKLSEIDKLF